MERSPPSLSPHIGIDGIPTDSPVIAYTEKVLEEKELQLKKYIQDNYSKIRNVERELASLALEIKLTAGPKKAALEHLRKKIELSAEKIKISMQKEEQARKVWEAASKALKEEEENKRRLCEDLNRLVQESAAFQYSRLEELKRRLEALNPEITGGAAQASNIENGRVKLVPLPGDSSQHILLETKNEELKQTTAMSNKTLVTAVDPARASEASHEKEQRDVSKVVTSGDKIVGSTIKLTGDGESQTHKSWVGPGNHRKGRGSLVKGAALGLKHKPNTWTGAGFDVDDGTVNG